MSLQYLIKKERKEGKILNNYSLFLFGSYLNNTETAKDIDLLIVYDKKVLSTPEILSQRKNLKEIIRAKYEISVDILVLNKEEYKYSTMMKYINKVELK